MPAAPSRPSVPQRAAGDDRPPRAGRPSPDPRGTRRVRGNRGPRGARRPVTGRALILGAVVVLLVLLLAAPLHHYLAARSSVQQADQQRRQGEAQLAQLRQQDKELSDPAYIEQQARVRLQYAMPGDTVYIVVGPGQPNSLAKPTTPSTAPTRAPGGTWNQRLWGSIQAADHGS